jgi:hypothetical protein
MNIFYIDKNAIKAAEYMVDRHVVKMILETCQILSTAHRMLDGTPTPATTKSGRKTIRYVLPDDRDTTLYQATHINHPSCVWARKSTENYKWLHEHLMALLNEYTFRYGKVHNCLPIAIRLYTPPNNLPVGIFTDPTPAMDNKYIVHGSSLKSYRNYYSLGKTHLHKWTKRSAPDWMSV